MEVTYIRFPLPLPEEVPPMEEYLPVLERKRMISICSFYGRLYKVTFHYFFLAAVIFGCVHLLLRSINADTKIIRQYLDNREKKEPFTSDFRCIAAEIGNLFGEISNQLL